MLTGFLLVGTGDVPAESSGPASGLMTGHEIGTAGLTAIADTSPRRPG
ncbi:hypothetical protein AB0K60_30510 [Thermopolyspora sp. NPDC052614]